MLTLFRAATGENWHEIAYSLEKERAINFQCVEHSSYSDYKAAGLETVGCGSYYTTHFYFYSYIVLVSLVFLNLFIAIILQAFDDIQDQSNKTFNQDMKDLFLDCWVMFDPEGDKFIPKSKFGDLMFEIGHPLGWPEEYRDDEEV
jgi:hypothetical protein